MKMPSVAINNLPERILTGAGCAELAAKEVSGLNVLLITDKGLLASGLTDKVTRYLGSCEIFSDIGAEPRTDDLDRALSVAAGCKYDAIIGLGGGSALDVAKAVAALTGSGLSAADALGHPDIADPATRGANAPPLLIVMPTTAGTGSESTLNAIFIDSRDGVKKAIISRLCLPKIAVLDPELTISLPAKLTASTGVDALCHCVESLISIKADPISETFSKRGIRLIEQNLGIAVVSPDDMNARQNMLMASFWGGAALAIAGTAAVHALAYPLGKRGVPHGAANSMLFMPVMEFNLDACEDKLLSLGTGERSAAEVLARLGKMLKPLPISRIVEEFSISESEIDALAGEAMEQTRLLGNNPKPMSRSEAKSIYTKLF